MQRERESAEDDGGAEASFGDVNFLPPTNLYTSPFICGLVKENNGPEENNERI